MALMDSDPTTNKYAGFHRKEMFSEPLVGPVKHHDTHAFLVHGDAASWPQKEFEVDGDAATALHEALREAAGAFKSGVHQFSPGASEAGKVKLNLSEDGARSHPGDAPGDVLMFPQMRRHRLGPHLASSPDAVAAFVRDVVVSGAANRSSSGEPLRGAHVFVCTHAARDARCGLCGPALIDTFRDEVRRAGLADVVAVRGCSHTGGHKYAGNVLVFVPAGGVPNRRDDDGDDARASSKGIWYGYVTPASVREVIERTIRDGEVIPRLWRGSLGMPPEAHEAAAAEAAARLGEPWPPTPSPCDACDEDGGGVADIEDVVGGGGGTTGGGIAAASRPSAAAATGVGGVEGVEGVGSLPPSTGNVAAFVDVRDARAEYAWAERALWTSAAAGAVGLVAAFLAGASPPEW